MNTATPSIEPRMPPGIQRKTHLFFALLAGLVLTILVWGAVGRLDVVSTAMGQVVPSSQVKTVQHLEGGIVSEILVREGDTVEAGQSLMAMESMVNTAEVEELTVRIVSLTADVARLEAEMSGAALIFPDSFETDNPDLARQAQELYEAQRLRLNNERDQQLALISQRKLELEQVTGRLPNSRKSLALLHEQIAISEDLLKDDLTNRMQHLNLLKEATRIEGAINEDLSAIKRLKAAVTEAELHHDGILVQFREQARRQIDDDRRSLKEFTSRIRKYQDTLKRRDVLSPVSGVVKTLFVVTEGGVIPPGGRVADVVPMGDRLVIRAMLQPQDVGFVHPGQLVRVQLASGDAMRFGHIKGEVVHVSPDTVQVGEGNSFYKVRIATEVDYFESKGQRYRLVPGVQVTASIITGDRSVLEYIFSPFLGNFNRTMQER